VDLEEALTAFDRTEANLRRLGKALDELTGLIPEGIVFPGSSPEALRYAELERTIADIAAALPAIDGLRVEVAPPSLQEIAQTRLDAADIGEPQILIDLGESISPPARLIAAYRDRFSRSRDAWSGIASRTSWSIVCYRS
jgi:hypothetical protein